MLVINSSWKESLSTLETFCTMQKASVWNKLSFSPSYLLLRPRLRYSLVGPPPPFGFVKLNTDGSVTTPPGLANGGGLLRDTDEKWLRGYRNIGIKNSLVVELWALRDGLVLAHDLNIHKLIIKLDAKAIVDMLSDNNTNYHSHPYCAPYPIF